MKSGALILCLALTGIGALQAHAGELPYTVSVSPFLMNYSSQGAYHETVSEITEGILVDVSYPLNARWRLFITGASNFDQKFQFMDVGIGYSFFQEKPLSYRVEDVGEVVTFDKYRPQLLFEVGQGIAKTHISLGPINQEVSESLFSVLTHFYFGLAYTPRLIFLPGAFFYYSGNSSVTATGYGVTVGLQYNLF